MRRLPPIRLLIAALAMLAVSGGTAVADLQRGLDLFERGQFDAAHDALLPLAQSGDARAQYVVGVMYLNLFVEPPNADAALGLITASADQGYVQAQSELARMYRDGDGVARDPAQMVHWYERAAEAGDVGAQLLVADSYAYGQGVERDLVEAYKWYEIAIQYWGSLAVRARDVVGAEMTAEQVAESERRASVWLQNRNE